jgi:hypothetical protein
MAGENLMLVGRVVLGASKQWVSWGFITRSLSYPTKQNAPIPRLALARANIGSALGRLVAFHYRGRGGATSTSARPHSLTHPFVAHSLSSKIQSTVPFVAFAELVLSVKGLCQPLGSSGNIPYSRSA